MKSFRVNYVSSLIDPVIYLLFKEVSRTELKNTTFSLIKERKNGEKQRILLIFLQYFLCGKKTPIFIAADMKKRKKKEKNGKSLKKKKKTVEKIVLQYILMEY